MPIGVRNLTTSPWSDSVVGLLLQSFIIFNSYRVKVRAMFLSLLMKCLSKQVPLRT